MYAIRSYYDIDLVHWPRQEHRLDAFPQLFQDIGYLDARGDHQRREPVRLIISRKDEPVDDTRDFVQAVIEIRQRSAFAGNIDHVRLPASYNFV